MTAACGKHSCIKPSKHGILTIPPELFDDIARHARPQDLCALRLVSRDVAARVLKVYTEVHFTERSFLLYRESLQTLTEIVGSEYFGRQLKKVVLCVDELPPAAIQDIPRAEMEEAISILAEAGGRLAEIGQEMREQALPLAGQDIRLHHKNDEIQQSWSMLYDAFEQLRRLGNSPAVQVTTADLLSRKPRMYDTFSDQARSELWVNPKSNQRNFSILMAAIFESGLRVTELDMCPGEMDWMIWRRAFGVPLYTALRHDHVRILRNDVASVFKSLRKLKINMGELQEHTAEQGKNTEMDFAHMAEVFAGMDVLEELVLRQDARNAGFAPDLWLGKPFLALSFLSLRNLTLDGWEIDLRDLPAFLARQPRLERVRLSLCELTHALAHPAQQANAPDGSVARRLREATSVPVVIVTGSVYFVDENIDIAEYKFHADSASKADEEVQGWDTLEIVESW